MGEEILEKNKTLMIAVGGSPASSPSLHCSISPTATAASSSKLNPDAPAFVPRSPADAPPPASSEPPQPVHPNRRGPNRAGRSNQRGRDHSDGPNQRGGRGRSAGSNQRGRGRSSERTGPIGRFESANRSGGPSQRGGRMNRSGGSNHRRGKANRSAGQNQRGAKANRSGSSNRRGAKANRSAGSKQRGAKRPFDASKLKLFTDEQLKKITNQVAYCFSDLNLATTEQLMTFILVDQEGEGYVAVSNVASFKKIKAPITKNSFIAYAVQTSSSELLTSAVLTHMDDGYLADDEGGDDDGGGDDDVDDDDDDDENNEANQQADEELGAGEVINGDAPMDVDPVLNLNDTRTIVVIGPVASRTADLIDDFIDFCAPAHRLEDGSYLVGFNNVVLRVVEFNDPEMNLPEDIQPDGFVLCQNVNLPVDVGTLHQWITAARMRSFDDAYIVLYGTDALEIEVLSVVEQNLAAFAFMIHRCRY